MNYFERTNGDIERYARWLRDACIWLTIAVTLFSGWAYISKGIALYHHPKEQPSAA